MKISWLTNNITPSLCEHLRNSVMRNILVQAVLYILSGLILDGGFCGQVCLFATVVWACGSFMISIRRPQTPASTDLLFMELGYLALIVVGFVSSPFWGWLRK
jgi:hypothetical protein